MHDAFQEFGMLLAAIWGSKGDKSMVLTPPIVERRDDELRLGADAHGNRHLLASIPHDHVVVPRKGEAIELADWRHPETGERYMDLVCRSDKLAVVFSRLADEIVRRNTETDSKAHIVVVETINDWQELFRPARSVTEELARGLFGELQVLQLLAFHNPHVAVDVWVGPSGHVHDFSSPNGDLEVKTGSGAQVSVIVSSLNQLDQMGGRPLTLVRLQANSDPQGKCLGDMVDDLEGLGCYRPEVLARLVKAGFVLGSDNDEHRFSITQAPRAWAVTGDFPGLRSGDLPRERSEAITSVKYSLDLLNAPGKLSSDEWSNLLVRLMTQ